MASVKTCVVLELKLAIVTKMKRITTLKVETKREVDDVGNMP